VEYAILTDEITKAWSGMTTTELSKAHNPQSFEENREIAKRGGKYAGNARKEIEADTGKPVITSKNASELNRVVVDLIENISKEDE